MPWRKNAVLIPLVIALTLAVLPPVFAQTPPYSLGLQGPASGLVDQTLVFEGALASDTEPVGSVDIAIHVDGSPAATVLTDAQGAFTSQMTFPTAGWRDLEAVAFVGTADETRSPVHEIQITAPDQVVADLSLTGPTDARPGQEVTYRGTLLEEGQPVAGEQVDLFVDGVSAAATTTASNGTFSAPLTLPNAGSHFVQARSAAGAPNESRSAVLWVEVVPVTQQEATSEIAVVAESLYEGPNPVQVGVQEGVIEPEQAALVKGAVTTDEGAPLAGVEVSVADHPELGHTTTSQDAVFDMAVNGGEDLVVTYEKPGYLPVEREVDVSVRDYESAGHVVLTPLAAEVTTVDLATITDVEVAQAAPVEDDRGERAATLMVEPGTDAEMVLDNGTVQPLESVDIRATEFTVGDTGVAAMPGDLPGTSAYTYAVEYSVDEALAAGADQVNFSKPLATYTDNFLEFPVGTAVPTGYYDRDRHAWIASKDGLVIGIVADGAEVGIDSDGDGMPESLTELQPLGVTADELAELDALYDAGDSLWRVEVDHFTPWDYNWPFGPEPGAVGPGMTAAIGQFQDGDCQQTGSVIGCQNQTLGESIGVTGTPFSLHYDTARVPGFRASYALDIPLTTQAPPEALRGVTLDVEVAGRRFHKEFAPQPNLSYWFDWDGRDAEGRYVQGALTATIKIGYVYRAVYYATSGEWRRSFGQAGGAPIAGNGTRREFVIYQEYEKTLGGLPAPSTFSLGGWSLSAHHAYDDESQTLYLGTGEARTTTGSRVGLTTAAGNGAAGSVGEGTLTGNGGPARQAGLGEVGAAVVNGAGVMYVADTSNGVIRRVARNGTISAFAGGGPGPGNGDGANNAAAAVFEVPTDLALGSDKSVYVLDTGSADVRRIGPDGVVSTVAGGGVDGFGDGGDARAAELFNPRGIALGPQDTLYIADTGNHRIRRVDPDGTITTIAGGGSSLGDGGVATAARLFHPTDVAVAPDGTLYIADSGHRRIRMVTPAGTISTIAGTGETGSWKEGEVATAAAIGRPRTLAIDPANGAVYFTERGQHRVARISAGGFLVTAAGTGKAGSTGDGGTAVLATLRGPRGISIDPDGRLVIADTDNFKVRRVMAALPAYSRSNVVIPSEDGSEAYQFDNTGRHLSTRDSLTGALVYEFHYDGAGRLSRVEDSYGNTTTIQRNAAGEPTAVVSPFGATTGLTVGPGGYLTSVTDPANATTNMAYQEGGLLQTFETPRADHTFTYDALGRLIRDDGPNGFSVTLERRALNRGWEVTTTSSEGVETTYRTQTLPDGTAKRTVIDGAGGVSESLAAPDGTVTLTSADGTRTEIATKSDPRWGPAVPVLSSMKATTPGGKTLTVTATRTVALADVNDPLTLTSQSDSLTSNSKTTTRVFNGTNRTITTTTPAGRTSVTTLNSLGRPVSIQAGTLAPVTYRYDAFGRVDQVTEGTGMGARVTAVSYDAQGRFNGVVDPLQQETAYRHDGAGRVTGITLPDDSEIGFAYDAHGNVTSLTPPGKGAHAFGHYASDDVETYTPPGAGAEGAVGYGFDDDRRPTSVDVPGPRSIAFAYDGGGRLSTMTFSRGATTYAYKGDTSRPAIVTAPGNQATSFAYDGSLVTSIASAGAAAGSVDYTYNANLMVSGATVRGSAAVADGYDADGLLTSAGALSLTRHPSNATLSSTSLASVASSHTYNVYAEPTGDTFTAGTAQLYDATYTRDSLGRITAKTETTDGTTRTYAYTYDARGRLTDVARDGSTWRHYDYDANGNRTGATEGAASMVTAEYDGQDRIVSYGETTFEHDAMGQLTSKTVGSETTTYDYDELGNLVGIDLPGKTIDYVVDGFNRRVARKIDGATTNRYLYGQGLLPVAELNADGSVKSRFVFASRGHVPDYMVKGGATYRFVTDQVGSVRLVVNTSDGTVAQRIDYDPFGKVLSDTNPGFQPFGFAGGLYDHETGLVRFGLRDYDAGTGRWTAKDPILFEGGDSNLYAYVGGDSINFVDPTGEFAFLPFVFTAWAIVEVASTAYDIYNAASTLADSCASGAEKGMSIVFVIIGGVAPGGGYGAADEIVEGGGRLFRMGDEYEDAARLAEQARRAEAAGLPHGVSTFSSSTKADAVSASRSQVERHFKVRQTGKNPQHYTVELPQPVTDEVAELFNGLFGRKK
ncbi:MAG: hypothetical protein M3134_10740 [Actinomycetota bacterium]|nr:hypothetical protein [Actinomycetota bacterium]